MRDASDLLADGLCTAEQAADYLQVSRTTVYSMMQHGELPYTHVRRGRRIPRRALVELARQNLVAPDCQLGAHSQAVAGQGFVSPYSQNVATGPGTDAAKPTPATVL